MSTFKAIDETLLYVQLQYKPICWRLFDFLMFSFVKLQLHVLMNVFFGGKGDLVTIHAEGPQTLVVRQLHDQM